MAISTFLGLQTSLRGLLAEQRALDTTGHNIANAATPGYSRQEAVLSAAPAQLIPSGAIQGGGGAQIGGGVEVQAFRRIRDQFLDVQYRGQSMRLGEQAARTRSLEQAELSLSEPGSNGLSALLGRYWSAWGNVANSPEVSSPAARQALVDSAQVLTGAIRELDTQLQSVAAQAGAEYAALTGPAGQVASLAGQLSGLNDEIRAATVRGESPNDLLDKRDLLLDELSSLGQVSTQELGDGALTVSFGDAALPLIDGTTRPSTTTWPQTLTTPGGRLGALKDLASATGPVAGYRAELAGVAKQLADSVNALHPTPFFTYTAGNEAATLAVAVTAAGVQPTTGAAAGGNDVAIAIAALRGGVADNAYTTLVARIGEDSRSARRQEANVQVLSDAVSDRRDAVSGVSMDEEMANLVRFQRGYQACARAMTTADEILDVLINRTGRVGL